MTEEIENPLQADSPSAWDQLIQAVGPASLLVVIESRMSQQLKQRHSAEDILQEALMHAWRDRGLCQWQGIKSFRSWLLSIIDNRIRDIAEHEGAQKRGGGLAVIPYSAFQPDGSQTSQAGGAIGPIVSATPKPDCPASRAGSSHADCSGDDSGGGPRHRAPEALRAIDD